VSGTSKIQEINREILRGNLDEIRRKLATIDPHDAQITVLALQPGIGKSTWAINYCKDHPEIENIGIATKRHNFLRELEAKIPDFNHWHGLKRICPRKDEKWFKKLYDDFGLQANVICSVCGRKAKCPYHQQFKDHRRCGFPTEYLRTKYVNEFDMLFVEESIYETEEYCLDLEKTLDVMQTYDLPKDLIWRVQYFEYDQDDLNYLRRERDRLLRVAVQNEDFKVIPEIQRINVDALEHCRYKNPYYLPRLFKVFEIAQEKPVVLLHAGFVPPVFKRVLARYYQETLQVGSEAAETLRVKIYESTLQNKDTKIYRITNSDYSKNTVNNYKKSEIDTILRRIVDIYGKDRVGVLTYMQNVQKDAETGTYIFNGVKAGWFGNVSGLNEFEDVPVLVIVGSKRMSVDQVFEKYEQLFGEEVSEEDREWYKGQIKQRTGKGIKHRYEPLDELGQALKKSRAKLKPIDSIDAMEHYDAIHRSRGLLHDRTVFLLGALPEKCKNEFSIEEIRQTDIEKFFERLKDKEGLSKKGGSKNMLIEILDLYEKGLTPTQIARELDLRIPGTTKYHTKPIRTLVKGYEECAELYDQILKGKNDMRRRNSRRKTPRS